MRLRELEVLEKVAANGKLKIVLGDKGLADKSSTFCDLRRESRTHPWFERSNRGHLVDAGYVRQTVVAHGELRESAGPCRRRDELASAPI